MAIFMRWSLGWVCCFSGEQEPAPAFQCIQYNGSLRVLFSGPTHPPSPSSFLPPPHCFLMTVKTPFPAQTFLPNSTPTPLTAWRTFPPGWSTSHPNCEQGPNHTRDILLSLPPPPGCVLHENLVEVLFISVHESAEKRGRMLVRR